MEDIIRNDESDKPAAAPKTTPKTTPAPKPTTRKPSATGVTASKTAADPAKTTPRRSTAKPAAKPAAQLPGSNTSAGPARPTAKKPADTITPAAEKAPGISAPVAKKKSKKLAKDFKKLKVQKREIASLEKNRDRIMKDLISAIENKKKSNKIRSLARDFNRIEKRVKNRTASYMQAKKKLTKKMK